MGTVPKAPSPGSERAVPSSSVDTRGRSVNSLRGLSWDRLNRPMGERSIPPRSVSAGAMRKSTAANSSLISSAPSSNSSSAAIRMKSLTSVAVNTFQRLASNPRSSVTPSSRTQRACSSA